MGMEAAARTLAVRRIRLADVGEVAIPEAGHGDNPAGSASDATKARAGVLRSQPGRRRCSSRTEFMLRSCQERARHVLLDRTLFSLTPEQSQALLADLEDGQLAQVDRCSIDALLAAPAPWDDQS